MSEIHWPALDYAAWKDTAYGLHRWTQIVGKYRLAVTPWLNHSWHATFYVTPWGMQRLQRPTSLFRAMRAAQWTDAQLWLAKTSLGPFHKTSLVSKEDD